mmetsp:Transcript_474/g.1052  ORF Transcript_474/g.1052 Transcript_474/m.1052 type:complete len:532 (-) Transcript_474:8-1603(-)
MGNCVSSTDSNQRRNNHDGNTERQWSDRGPWNGSSRRVIQSMARVGSRVFRQSSMELDLNAAGTTDEQNGNPRGHTLKEHKASTYEHVHEMVEQGIDNWHETNANGQGNLSGRVGLTNLGNTCFMNSSLQCLSNTIPLTDYFLGYDFRGEVNHDNFLGTKGQLVSSYAELTKHLWLGSDLSYQPKGFKSNLARFAPQFEGYEQQDAQELLAFLLDGIHEDLNRVRKRACIEEKDCNGTNDEGDAITAWSHYLLRNQSIIVDLFQGQLRNTMSCRNKQPDGTHGCGHVNVKFDPFMYLSLPISDKCNSLDDCLDLFCEEELLAGDEQWYCPKCKTHVNATKKIDLFMLPPILIIHLKRFKFSMNGQKSKIDRSIRYPLDDWNLKNMKKSESGIYPLYDLYAISHHKGNVASGHYTAHAKNRFDGKWYNFNDSQCHRVDPLKEQLGSGSSAYCLFYNRVERVPQANGRHLEKKTVIRRQSISRPELWPHLQRAKAAEWKSVRTNDHVWDNVLEDDDDEEQNEKYNHGLSRITE